MAFAPLVEPAPALTEAERARYDRHLLVPEVGLAGQLRLKNAKVLVVGAGGLGSPALLYLAAAGVGTVGVVDDDVVDVSNLQRQVAHGVADVGRPKTESAADRVAEVNPLVTVVQHPLRLDAGSVLDVLRGYDLVVDGSDNFPTRYLVADACALLGIPHVWGSVLRFDGQVSVWWAGHGPCLRCVFPAPPAAGAVPSCAEAGVLGATCAAVASVQVAEAVKLVVGTGEPLVGRLLVHDGLAQRWDTLVVRRDPACALCGESPTITSPTDGQAACMPPAAAAAPAPERSLTVHDLADRLRARSRAEDAFLLVDVREPAEREIVVIPGSESIPLGEFRAGTALARLPDGIPVLVHCKSGARSAEAASLLRHAGRQDVWEVSGGVLAWAREVDPRLPVY